MRLVLAMVLAVVASLVVGMITVTVVAAGHDDPGSIVTGFLATWAAVAICLPVFAIAASRQYARRALFGGLRYLTLGPMAIVIGLKLSTFAGMRPAWAAGLSGEAEFSALVGFVAVALVQWRIFLWHAGRRPVAEPPLPVFRFGRQPK